MDINLDVSAPEWLAAPKQTFLYRTIVDALQSSRLSDSQAKSRAIENSTIYLCTSVGSRKESQDVMRRFSKAVVAIIWHIPHDHIYQDILTDAVISLRKRTEPIAKFGKGETFWNDWESLPELYMFIADMRQDLIACFGEQAPREKITNFQRLTSFTARLKEAGYTKWMNWPALDLSHALGAPCEKGMTFDGRLWIRLVEIKENWDEWEFKDTTLERVKQAIQAMETVEQRYAKPAEEEQKGDKCADSAIKGAR
ncbi:hypothetical protein LA080_012223 [Diaporthe eres]|nr:hypothetical protein LA080_012223 [Diaporthe eres]